jgi:hypothetical protein
VPGTEAIVGIFGEVDRAVQLDPLARLRVSQLLPEYQIRGVRWYDDFLKWLAETRAEPGDFPRWLAESSEEPRPEGPRAPGPFPNVIEALDALTVDDLADARIRARLIFATAVAARAFPQIEQPDSLLRREAVSTLSRFVPDEPFAEELLELLSDDRPERFGIRQIPGTPGWWRGVLGLLDSRGISTIGMEAKPCTARLVTVPGIDGPAAALRTEFDTEALNFKTATNFMEPENWRTCRRDFWCCMEDEPDPKLIRGQRRYHEIVSSNCKNPRALFRAETRLLFNFMWIPTEEHALAVVANYELADQPPRQKDLIQVDEGSLLVSRLDRPGPDGGSKRDARSDVDGPEKLRITTTKRIKFNYPFSSQAIALMVCALGWLDTGAQLVACAAAEGVGMWGGTPFPGESTTDAMKARSERADSPSGGPPGSLGDLCQEGVDIWARALRDGAAALERHGGGGPEE